MKMKFAPHQIVIILISIVMVTIAIYRSVALYNDLKSVRESYNYAESYSETTVPLVEG